MKYSISIIAFLFVSFITSACETKPNQQTPHQITQNITNQSTEDIETLPEQTTMPQQTPNQTSTTNASNDSQTLHEALTPLIREHFQNADFNILVTSIEGWVQIRFKIHPSVYKMQLRDQPPITPRFALVYTPTKTLIPRGDWHSASPFFVALATKALQTPPKDRKQLLIQMANYASILEYNGIHVFNKRIEPQTMFSLGMNFNSIPEPETLSTIEALENGWQFKYYLEYNDGMSAPMVQEYILKYINNTLKCSLVNQMKSYDFVQNNYQFEK